jgi:hypothetical protein
MSEPGLAGLLLQIIRRIDLRALTESVASDAELFSAAAAVRVHFRASVEALLLVLSSVWAVHYERLTGKPCR